MGIAVGDGNLSNPNGRAVRLRVTCDTKYPRLIKNIMETIRIILPDNKVSVVKRAKTYIDISCYSNQWELILGWKVGKGSKYQQQVSIPDWIQKEKKFVRLCLRGLIETDGSIYMDRGYRYVNFVTTIAPLAYAFQSMTRSLGYKPNTQIHSLPKSKKKYTIRISKQTERFIRELALKKE